MSYWPDPAVDHRVAHPDAVRVCVRGRLTERDEELAGLYAGNPKRTTAQPTAENLLEAFQEINLNVATIGQQIQRYITPLSELQQKILALLDFPENIYTRLATASQNPP